VYCWPTCFRCFRFSQPPWLYFFLKRAIQHIYSIYRVIIKYCTIVVGVGGLVECAVSFITWVRLVSPIGGAPGGSRNLSTSLSVRGWRHIQNLCGFSTPTTNYYRVSIKEHISRVLWNSNIHIWFLPLCRILWYQIEKQRLCNFIYDRFFDFYNKSN
jgi:hypothetical protein